MGCINLNSPEVIPNPVEGKRTKKTSLLVIQLSNFGMVIRNDNASIDA